MITVDPTSPVPPYEQVRAGIAAAVRSGELTPGTRLPTVRGLAADLGLAVNTVAKAYRELERDQVVETRGRHGTFVPAREGAAGEQAQVEASDFAERMSRLGVEASEALAMVRAAFKLRD